jgi:hypothetical protein
VKAQSGVDRAVEVVAAAACIAALVWSFAWERQVPLLAAVDLGFHELGHLLGGFMPPVGQVLAGSTLQVAVPIGLAVYFWFVRHEPGATGLMLAWAGTAARDVSVYVADAPYQALPLIGGRHDWAYIFGPEVLGNLSVSRPVSQVVWSVGLALVLGGLGVAVLALVRPSAPARQ